MQKGRSIVADNIDSISLLSQKYGHNYKETLGRMRELFNSSAPSALIQIRNIGEIKGVEMPALNAFSFPQEMKKYLDLRADALQSQWLERANLQDDTLPGIAPFYGIAEHTAFLGGDVVMERDTSYHRMVMQSWDDFCKLRLDPDNTWLHMVTDGIRYYAETRSSSFFTTLRGADGPSDIANALRGNDILFDVYDEPEKVRMLVDFCADAARFTLNHQREAAGMLDGGYITGMGIWLPGDSIGHISEDFSCFVSPEMYSELFLDGLKKTVRGYDNALLHVHSVGAAMLPMFAEIPEITAIEISNDPNAPRAVDVWRKYREELSEKVVVIHLDNNELENNIDLIKENRCIVWYSAETFREADAVIERIRGLH